MAKRTAEKSEVRSSAAEQKLHAVRGHAVEQTSGLERLIHERLRLGIISALAVNESLSFKELRELLKTTDGNLSVHARKLEEADYIRCLKSFDGRVPRTEYRITSSGRKALQKYLDHMEALIAAMRK